MALKHKLDTLDGLDEALKPLYAKGDDGRFTLQVDEAPATNTIAKLKADLDAATKALKEREANEAKAKSDADNARLLAEGDFKKLSENAEARVAEATKREEAANTGLKSYLLKAELAQAIAANKGNPHLLKLVADQFEAVISPDGAHKVLVKGDPTKTPSQYIEGLRKDASYGAFFEGSGASGGAAPQSGHTSSHKAITNESFQKMNPVDRAAHFAGGGTLTE